MPEHHRPDLRSATCARRIAYVDSGTYTDATLATRRRLAEAMMKQGSDTSPISSHWQGLARLTNSLMGGYGIHKLGQEEKAANEKAGQTIADLYLGPTTPSATPGSPAPMVTPPDARGATGDYMDFVRKQEGFNPKPYGDYKQTSIGHGTKALPGETSITPEEGERRLRTELSQARQLVQGFGAKLSPKQEDALTDLTYNAGTIWMSSGLGQAVRAGDWQKAAELFQQYTKAGGQDLPGLVKRRQAAAPWLLDQSQPAPDMMVEGGLPMAPQGLPQGGPTAQPMPPSAPVQVAQAPGGTMTDAALGLSPHRAAQLRAALANPRTAPAARAIIAQLQAQQTKQDAPTDDIKEYRFDMAQRMQSGQKPLPFQEWIASKRNAASPKSGLTPQYMRDKDGNVVPFVVRNDGTTQRLNLGDGMTALGPGGVTEERELAKARAEAKDKLFKIESDANSTIKYIEDIEKDPYLSKVIGPIDNWTPNIFNRGTQAKIDQLSGRGFLSAFESLKGGGAITETEGQKATAALSRLQEQGMSEGEYMKALGDFKQEIRNLLAIAKKRAAGHQPGSTQQGGPAAGTRLRYNPATGELE